MLISNVLACEAPMLLPLADLVRENSIFTFLQHTTEQTRHMYNSVMGKILIVINYALTI